MPGLQVIAFFLALPSSALPDSGEKRSQGKALGKNAGLQIEEKFMSNETRVEFKGTGMQALGWGIVAISLSIFILPAAWGAVILYRWFVKNLSFSDGTRATFEGRGIQVWGYFVIAVLLGFLPMLSRSMKDPIASMLSFWALYLLAIAVIVAVYLKILRWFISNIRLSCGTELSFEGSYLQYLGWMMLITVSVFTVIGWAWAAVAMLRWLLRNIKGGDHQVIFLGNGWGLLWRSVLASLASFFVIPTPWVSVWMVKWIAGNISIVQIQAGHDIKLL